MMTYLLAAAAAEPSAASVAVQSYTVDLSPILTGIILPVVGAVLSAIVPMLVIKLIALAHIKITEAQMAAIQRAAANAASVALGKAAAAGVPLAHVAVHDQAVADALTYMATNMPDALRKAGVSGQQLENIVTAKLAQAAVSSASVEPPRQPSPPA